MEKEGSKDSQKAFTVEEVINKKQHFGNIFKEAILSHHTNENVEAGFHDKLDEENDSDGSSDYEEEEEREIYSDEDSEDLLINSFVDESVSEKRNNDGSIRMLENPKDVSGDRIIESKDVSGDRIIESEYELGGDNGKNDHVGVGGTNSVEKEPELKNHGSGIKNVSGKLQLLLSKNIPLQDKLQKVNRIKEEKGKGVRKILAEEKQSRLWANSIHNSLNMDCRITRSQWRLKNNQDKRSELNDVDDQSSGTQSTTSGVALRLEEIGDKCGFRKIDDKDAGSLD
ncbi:hypothetical protein L2E82_26912 [Cichorium intybus]|uniref:Uncharacterized protein n=1 Tax=Cichorium intybus TaxID=13427 RepID=A0ACB9CRX2_CICIN|nr:hypothetical protein L2E82_26912 [Cichorium intybus]